MRSTPHWLLTATLLVTAIASATDIPAPRLGPPILLRLDGVIGTDRTAAKAAGFTVTSFQFLQHGRDDDRVIGVNDARTVGGDVGVLGKDVLEAVAPFDPNFIATGPAPLVRDLLAVPSGTAIRIEGMVDRGSRTFLIRSFERRDPAP